MTEHEPCPLMTMEEARMLGLLSAYNSTERTYMARYIRFPRFQVAPPHIIRLPHDPKPSEEEES